MADERILIYAPYGRDGQVIGEVLAGAGMTSLVCISLGHLCAEVADGAGAVVVAVEAFTSPDLQCLAEVLAAQPPWSDLPLVVLCDSRDAKPSQKLVIEFLGAVGNINMLQRPLRVEALLNAATLALRARRRQYQAQAHMIQLEEIREVLARANAEAVRANEAKSRFLAAASHDLRQPFQAMRLFHHVVAQALRDTPTAEAAVHLGEAIRSGEDLLNALLDLSTLEAGVTKVGVSDVPLAEVLLTVANDLGAIAAGKHLSLRVRPYAATVSSDPVLLKRIVRNLTINAIRYTERGKVLIGCRPRSDHVLIQVWDTGIGIAADKLGRIFEDFYQVDNAERDRAKGIGLGLSIVDRMAQLLNHPVSVRSWPGRGSVFSIRVPRSR